ncbi:MAG: hypothetical protein ACXVHR_07030 [Methanobacterium sp.]
MVSVRQVLEYYRETDDSNFYFTITVELVETGRENSLESGITDLK